MIEVEQAVEQLRNQGYAVIPALLPEDTCQLLCQQLHIAYEKYSEHYAGSAQVDKFHGDQTKIVYNLHNKHPGFLQLLSHRMVIDCIQPFLHERTYKNAEPFILKLSAGRTPVGTGDAQPMHIDSLIPGADPPLVMQALWALDDFSVTNGSTQLVPKSHFRKTFPPDNQVPEDAVQVDVPKGSLLLFNGALWHGSGPKNTPGDRWAAIYTYARWYMKPSFDHTQNTPASVYQSLTELQKQLLGFDTLPPKDEFTRLTRRSIDFEPPQPYRLPMD